MVLTCCGKLLSNIISIPHKILAVGKIIHILQNWASEMFRDLSSVT